MPLTVSHPHSPSYPASIPWSLIIIVPDVRSQQLFLHHTHPAGATRATMQSREPCHVLHSWPCVANQPLGWKSAPLTGLATSHMPGSGHSQPSAEGGENTQLGTLIQSTVVAIKIKHVVSRSILIIEICLWVRKTVLSHPQPTHNFRILWNWEKTLSKIYFWQKS